MVLWVPTSVLRLLRTFGKGSEYVKLEEQEDYTPPNKASVLLYNSFSYSQ